MEIDKHFDEFEKYPNSADLGYNLPIFSLPLRLVLKKHKKAKGAQVVQDDVAARSGALFSCSPACSPCCGAPGVAVAAVALPEDPYGEVPAATVVVAAAAAPETFRATL